MNSFTAFASYICIFTGIPGTTGSLPGENPKLFNANMLEWQCQPVKLCNIGMGTLKSCNFPRVVPGFRAFASLQSREKGRSTQKSPGGFTRFLSF